MPVLITGFSDACLKRPLEYDYPGNILELRHIVEYAISLSQAEKCRSNSLGHKAGGSCSQPISKGSSQVRGHTFERTEGLRCLCLVGSKI
jgi:DNA-binding NtrC family response regulator